MAGPGARRLGVTRQSLTQDWITERLDREAFQAMPTVAGAKPTAVIERCPPGAARRPRPRTPGRCVAASAGGPTSQAAPAQQPPTTAVGGDPPAVETAHHLAPPQGVKFQLCGITLCRHRPGSWSFGNVWSALTTCTRARPVSIQR